MIEVEIGSSVLLLYQQSSVFVLITSQSEPSTIFEADSKNEKEKAIDNKDNAK